MTPDPNLTLILLCWVILGLWAMSFPEPSSVGEAKKFR